MTVTEFSKSGHGHNFEGTLVMNGGEGGILNVAATDCHALPAFAKWRARNLLLAFRLNLDLPSHLRDCKSRRQNT